MPSDYIDIKFASQLQQQTITQEMIDEMKALYGLDDNSFGGILKGYFSWLWKALQGDWGISFKYGLPVWTVIKENMWISFELALIALILEYLIALPIGIRAATHQYGAFDYSVSVISMIGISLPSFFFAGLLIKVFSVDLGWFPTQGLITASASYSGFRLFIDKAWHLFLPMTVLVVTSLGGLIRYTRTNTLEVLNSDYIRTARAKGLPEKKVIYVHAFRNTLIPIVTMLAGALPSLFGGAMITEQVFSIPGIGNMAYEALKMGDIPFIMGYNMFLALLTVIGTLLSDIVYTLVDPRVKIAK
jgi:peptide/nickel transport system permease protein